MRVCHSSAVTWRRTSDIVVSLLMGCTSWWTSWWTSFGESLRRFSAPSRTARIELAAAYRLVAHFGWDDLIFTHISARVPGQPDQFLINPYGMLFDEITAADGAARQLGNEAQVRQALGLAGPLVVPAHDVLGQGWLPRASMPMDSSPCSTAART